MNYEIVELKEKTIVGFAGRTSNDDPKMGDVISGLWQKLYTPENVSGTRNRVNTYAIGLYSDYDEKGYQVTAGFEVSKACASGEQVIKVIPAGKYAKFQIHGDYVEAVSKAWGEIWNIPLDRTDTGDFEEYRTMEDIDIYIAIR